MLNLLQFLKILYSKEKAYAFFKDIGRSEINLFEGSALFKILDYRQMLRANGFALSALQTVTGFSSALSSDPVCTFTAVKAWIQALMVLDSEYLRDRDTHRTSLSAIVARSARNGFISKQRFLCLCDNCRFLF